MMHAERATAEFYRPVPGFPRYRIGRNGRVWFNLTRPGLPAPWDRPLWKPLRRRWAGGVLTCRLTENGGREYTRSVPLLLQAAFSDDPAGWAERLKPSAPHRTYLGKLWDGSDLVYDDEGDPVLPLSSSRGTRNGRARLNEQDVLEIRRLQADGLALVEIVRRLEGKATKGTVHAVLSGRTWRHIGLAPGRPAPSIAVTGRARRARGERLLDLIARARDAAETLQFRQERTSRGRRRELLGARLDVVLRRLGRLRALQGIQG